MSRGGLTISLTLISLYRTLWAMSRKNRSKFIAFPLNNSQICKAALGRERREREERPENDSKRAPPSLHPRQNQRPGAPAILPAVPAYTDRGQPRRAPENREINSAFVEYAELPLTNAAHAIPGEARQGGRFTF